MKAISKTVVAILVLGLVAQQSSQIKAAQRAGNMFMSYGPTTQSCGSWVASTGGEKEILRWWLFGFVTGVDYVGDVPLTRTDTKGIEVWIDKYCGDHPLVPIAKAAIDLVAELGARVPR